MLKFAVLLAATVLSQVPATAQGMPEPGDYYMISRETGREFRGSHKIFKQTADGLRKVTYCGREYWVRPYTVAWTQMESEKGLEVRVEYNWGKGWRPICEDPETQVTLADLGITTDPSQVTFDQGESQTLESRFGEIGRAFRGN